MCGPILDSKEFQQKAIKELNSIGIKVNIDGTINYDTSKKGMTLIPPFVSLLRHSYTAGTQAHKFMSDTSENAHIILEGEQKIKSELLDYCKKNHIDFIIVCSDIPRVTETAELLHSVNSMTPIHYYVQYKGINNGGWEGKTKKTLDDSNLQSYIEREEKHNIFAKSSQGESWAQVLLNCRDLINLLNEKYYNKKVVLVGQGSILRGINILTRKYNEPWQGYDIKKLYNLAKVNDQDNYGTVSEVCNNMLTDEDGMIHGRFQPFHKGHMKYLKKALARITKGHKLYVGITKPFITDNGMSTGDDHRDLKHSNPYTFEQRKKMIEESVRLDPEITDRLEDIIVIPWPMNNEVELFSICEKIFPNKGKIIQFMNVIPGDDWEKKKKELIESLGFHTIDLVDPQQPRMTSATDVRGLKNMPNEYKPKETLVEFREEKGKTEWEVRIPEGTRKIIAQIDRGEFDKKGYVSFEEYLKSI